ncbi:MAG: hypothetical protein Hyperionvirus22_13 [Hyperionvirus sp.]|uniref:Uncharacterized protein n=1 Tax=Hyperionvirus sp. TaxID=2487770 RepID=A0A3G5AB02_9VIRU|nr:MAG: hypothetical protein Hyperionvirus22_13 [Hyperionvirus sp.]
MVEFFIYDVYIIMENPITLSMANNLEQFVRRYNWLVKSMTELTASYAKEEKQYEALERVYKLVLKYLNRDVGETNVSERSGGASFERINVLSEMATVIVYYVRKYKEMKKKKIVLERGLEILREKERGLVSEIENYEKQLTGKKFDDYLGEKKRIENEYNIQNLVPSVRITAVKPEEVAVEAPEKAAAAAEVEPRAEAALGEALLPATQPQAGLPPAKAAAEEAVQLATPTTPPQPLIVPAKVPAKAATAAALAEALLPAAPRTPVQPQAGLPQVVAAKAAAEEAVQLATPTTPAQPQIIPTKVPAKIPAKITPTVPVPVISPTVTAVQAAVTSPTSATPVEAISQTEASVEALRAISPAKTAPAKTAEAATVPAKAAQEEALLPVTPRTPAIPTRATPVEAISPTEASVEALRAISPAKTAPKQDQTKNEISSILSGFTIVLRNCELQSNPIFKINLNDSMPNINDLYDLNLQGIYIQEGSWRRSNIDCKSSIKVAYFETCCYDYSFNITYNDKPFNVQFKPRFEPAGNNRNRYKGIIFVGVEDGHHGFPEAGFFKLLDQVKMIQPPISPDPSTELRIILETYAAYIAAPRYAPSGEICKPALVSHIIFPLVLKRNLIDVNRLFNKYGVTFMKYKYSESTNTCNDACCYNYLFMVQYKGKNYYVLYVARKDKIELDRTFNEDELKGVEPYHFDLHPEVTIDPKYQKYQFPKLGAIATAVQPIAPRTAIEGTDKKYLHEILSPISIFVTGPSCRPEYPIFKINPNDSELHKANDIFYLTVLGISIINGLWRVSDEKCEESSDIPQAYPCCCDYWFNITYKGNKYNIQFKAVPDKLKRGRSVFVDIKDGHLNDAERKEILQNTPKDYPRIPSGEARTNQIRIIPAPRVSDPEAYISQILNHYGKRIIASRIGEECDPNKIYFPYLDKYLGDVVYLFEIYGIKFNRYRYSNRLGEGKGCYYNFLFDIEYNKKNYLALYLADPANDVISFKKILNNEETSKIADYNFGDPNLVGRNSLPQPWEIGAALTTIAVPAKTPGKPSEILVLKPGQHREGKGTKIYKIRSLQEIAQERANMAAEQKERAAKLAAIQARRLARQATQQLTEASSPTSAALRVQTTVTPTVAMEPPASDQTKELTSILAGITILLQKCSQPSNPIFKTSPANPKPNINDLYELNIQGIYFDNAIWRLSSIDCQSDTKFDFYDPCCYDYWFNITYKEKQYNATFNVKIDKFKRYEGITFSAIKDGHLKVAEKKKIIDDAPKNSAGSPQAKEFEIIYQIKIIETPKIARASEYVYEIFYNYAKLIYVEMGRIAECKPESIYNIIFPDLMRRNLKDVIPLFEKYGIEFKAYKYSKILEGCEGACCSDLLFNVGYKGEDYYVYYAKQGSAGNIKLDRVMNKKQMEAIGLGALKLVSNPTVFINEKYRGAQLWPSAKERGEMEKIFSNMSIGVPSLAEHCSPTQPFFKLNNEPIALEIFNKQGIYIDRGLVAHSEECNKSGSVPIQCCFAYWFDITYQNIKFLVTFKATPQGIIFNDITDGHLSELRKTNMLKQPRTYEFRLPSQTRGTYQIENIPAPAAPAVAAPSLTDAEIRAQANKKIRAKERGEIEKIISNMSIEVQSITSVCRPTTPIFKLDNKAISLDILNRQGIYINDGIVAASQECGKSVKCCYAYWFDITYRRERFLVTFKATPQGIIFNEITDGHLSELRKTKMLKGAGTYKVVLPAQTKVTFPRENIPSEQVGGFYEKYMKYKTKYINLKKLI